jgi:hypothetical protein
MKTVAENQALEILKSFSTLKANPRLTKIQVINCAILCIEREIEWMEQLMKKVDNYTLAFSAIILTKKEVIEILKNKKQIYG